MAVSRAHASTSSAPLALRTFDHIREDIYSSRLDPLARLIEEDLAARYHVSRTPVRDALKRLEIAGFLEATPAGGYVLRKPSLRETREIYQVRIHLEGEAAELAAQNATAQDLERLFHLADQSDAVTNDPRVSGFPFAQLNTDFHAALAAASGSAPLARLFRTLTDRLTTYYVTRVERLCSGSRSRVT
jgi:DNA-binding GntR family transcriptional regulator